MIPHPSATEGEARQDFALPLYIFTYFSLVRPRKSARLRLAPGIRLKGGRVAFVPRGKALNAKARCLSEPQHRRSRRCASNDGTLQHRQDVLLGLGAQGLLLYLAVLEGDQGRHRAHAVLARQVLYLLFCTVSSTSNFNASSKSLSINAYVSSSDARTVDSSKLVVCFRTKPNSFLLASV